MPMLVEPTVAVRESFLAAMQEFADEGRAGDNTEVGSDLAKWAGRWNTDDGFAAYVAAVLRDREEDAPRDPGWVPCTTLWWIDGSVYLSRIAILNGDTRLGPVTAQSPKPRLLRIDGATHRDRRPSCMPIYRHTRATRSKFAAGGGLHLGQSGRCDAAS